MYTLFTSLVSGLGTVTHDVWSWILTLDYIEFVPRVAIGLAVGFLIGLERRSRHKAVGVRTYMVISASSALITMAGVMALAGAQGGDPTRLAGQIMSGIGMIGAGVILKRGFNATGVTTAAFILLAVGEGILAGFGFYAMAILSTLMVLLATILAGKHFSSREFAPPVHVTCKDSDPDDIIALFGAHAVLRGFKQGDNGLLSLTIQPMMSPAECEALLQRLLAHAAIVEATQVDAD
jgi:putative Mg2+ transporter-C (MgtC) family protein